jgi:hypothetical protein
VKRLSRQRRVEKIKESAAKKNKKKEPKERSIG